MPHLHHGAMGSSGQFGYRMLIVLALLVYLRGWFSLRSTSSELYFRLARRQFSDRAVLDLGRGGSPRCRTRHELLTVHMVQHLLLMTLAPPLIWLGEPVRLLSQGLPQTFVHTVRSRCSDGCRSSNLEKGSRSLLSAGSLAPRLWSDGISRRCLLSGCNLARGTWLSRYLSLRLDFSSGGPWFDPGRVFRSQICRSSCISFSPPCRATFFLGF